MTVKIWVNGVLHIIPDVSWMYILYITSLEYTKNKSDEVEHMTIKRGNKNENK